MMTVYNKQPYFLDAIETLKGCEIGQWRGDNLNNFAICIAPSVDLNADDFVMIYLGYIDATEYGFISNHIVATNGVWFGDSYDAYFEGYLVFYKTWLREQGIIE